MQNLTKARRIHYANLYQISVIIHKILECMIQRTISWKPVTINRFNDGSDSKMNLLLIDSILMDKRRTMKRLLRWSFVKRRVKTIKISLIAKNRHSYFCSGNFIHNRSETIIISGKAVNKRIKMMHPIVKWIFRYIR